MSLQLDYLPKLDLKTTANFSIKVLQIGDSYTHLIIIYVTNNYNDAFINSNEMSISFEH